MNTGFSARWLASGAALLALVCTVPVASDSAAVAPAAHRQAAGADAAAPYVRPDVVTYLKAFYAAPKPAFTREMLMKIHQLPPAALAAMSQQDLAVGDMAVIKDVTMPGPGGPMALRLFDTRADRAPGPVVVFYHGGGYVLGSIDTHAGLAAEIARQLDLPVVSVEYRLAPENPFPAAVDDGEVAARWIAANGKAFGRDFTGLILSGDSAGGNLTLVASAALRDKPAALPVVMQIPIYPASDFSKKYPSDKAFAEGYMLDAKSMGEFSAMYEADTQSLRASPLLGDLHGLPPTVLVTASLDPLRDQGRAYAAKLVEAGVPTTYYEGKGLIHGFATFRKAIPSAQDDTLAFLHLAKAMLAETSAN
ncbi:alpha/beta hydrolase [Novosphingobium album (ex Hu et al. 2023)]|uniref:Alpha/beta hydrolase n=1 Tax=Novosphingobium album (ex Hu et al. 2023) TaxID=2930093 RepID=A0ABT0AXY3_9SPHN|nr:alpha/beta hydrolase [Novosphingobium album (ex Hu et al. 2023)]MCJ2177642.1 alpha/beta hydrolase [Novosphingobium album (ex Hu et al. 2023)]